MNDVCLSMRDITTYKPINPHMRAPKVGSARGVKILLFCAFQAARRDFAIVLNAVK